MPRKKQKQTTITAAIMCYPWWFSAMLSISSFVFVTHILPSLKIKSAFSMPFLQAGKPILLFISAYLAVVAAIIYFRSIKVTSRNLSISTQPQLLHHSDATDLQKKPRDATSPENTTWSIELLHQLEWKRIEELTAAYFAEKSFLSEVSQPGPDGGVDVTLYIDGNPHPFALVQCKAWNTRKVGVKPVRELLGVMTSRNITKGLFIATGEFSEDAIVFAERNKLKLLNGHAFLTRILALPKEAQDRLLKEATKGDYKTPTCPTCGIKMISRQGKNSFWGCKNFPRCRCKIQKSL